MFTEIAVFHPKSRKKHITIEGATAPQAVDALAERLGKTTGDKVQSIINSMKRNDMDMSQLTIDDRRVRIRIDN
jgi:hypothetical protein